MGASCDCCSDSKSGNTAGNSDIDRLRVPKQVSTTESSIEWQSSGGDDTSEIDAMHRVSAVELGDFVVKRMNNKTLDRLWQHLDEDGSGQIESDEVLNILQWMGVLYVAYRFKRDGNTGPPKINKKKLKTQFVPMKDWIVTNKMQTKRQVRKNEFRKLFGAWLKEYALTLVS
eukprot:CAMPEP_0202702886 /NCGR_PEP_ID=MMETSP1385-20130828/15811_1 /ASSEMBLY_ACC=CAM_ASM_000861 /TAXON_ID=933848 /ORGANISM="Elphidium margaritaceum" /LENGTH=171 /DNA_ID=CAMNT_0049360633 /DNA_START=37 /DNA_END=552 /DNA_ORIENTATION=+